MVGPENTLMSLTKILKSVKSPFCSSLWCSVELHLDHVYAPKSAELLSCDWLIEQVVHLWMNVSDLQMDWTSIQMKISGRKRFRTRLRPAQMIWELQDGKIRAWLMRNNVCPGLSSCLSCDKSQRWCNKVVFFSWFHNIFLRIELFEFFIHSASKKKRKKKWLQPFPQSFLKPEGWNVKFTNLNKRFYNFCQMLYSLLQYEWHQKGKKSEIKRKQTGWSPKSGQ